MFKKLRKKEPTLLTADQEEKGNNLLADTQKLLNRLPKEDEYGNRLKQKLKERYSRIYYPGQIEELEAINRRVKSAVESRGVH